MGPHAPTCLRDARGANWLMVVDGLATKKSNAGPGAVSGASTDLKGAAEVR